MDAETQIVLAKLDLNRRAQLGTIALRKHRGATIQPM